MPSNRIAWLRNRSALAKHSGWPKGPFGGIGVIARGQTVRLFAMTDQPPTKLWQQLLGGVRSAVCLRIVTQIGEVEVNGEFDRPNIAFSGEKGDAIATSINLIDGDLTCVVPEKFWAPDKQVIRDFHQQQVEQGKAIVERNLQLIGELGSGIAKAIADLQKIEG